MLRRDFIGTGLLGIPALTLPLPGAKNSFRVLFVTDMHLTPAIEQSIKAADHLKKFINNNSQIDFVINGGDAVYDVAKLAEPAGGEMWEAAVSFFKGLNKPVYHCIGNHDIYEWELSEQTLTQPQKGKDAVIKHLQMPGRYYSFAHKDWRFVVLDSTHYVTKGYKGHLDEEQFQWLNKELLSVKEKNTCLVSHIPVVTACDTLYLPWAKHDVFPKIAERLSHDDAGRIFEATEQKNVPVFLHGHLHMRETIQYKQTSTHTIGAFCADMWKGPFHGFKPGFTLIDFAENGAVTLQNIDLPAIF